jgi:hypothetical protein
VHYLLMYELAPDYLARRGEFRNEHLKLAWEAEQRGEIVIAGALADPADTAVLLFTGDSPEAAERFAKGRSLRHPGPGQELARAPRGREYSRGRLNGDASTPMCALPGITLLLIWPAAASRPGCGS